MSEIKELMIEISNFTNVRDWDQFHTPKNLAMAIIGEAGELVSEFQWLKPEESTYLAMGPDRLRDIELEIADVAIYLFRLADKLNVDIAEVIRKKLKINEIRFPTLN